MKTERKIFVAFILNLIFSVVEFIGGIFTGSIAILSDSLHDFGDATSIGLSFMLEKKSKKKANDKYTYGYGRFSVLGGLITMVILLLGGIVVIYNSINRLISPIEIKYDAVIIIAVIGFSVNLISAIFTHGGHSINQKAVNLHMLEDVFGWVIVLIGAIVMRFTNFARLDAILSILVALFIIYNALKNLIEILEIFLLKTPKNLDLSAIKKEILEIDNVIDLKSVNVLSIDGEKAVLTVKAVVLEYSLKVKNEIYLALIRHDISSATIELVLPDEKPILLETNAKESHSHCHHHRH
jgi:cobalt-zinc-cadmium efflux system protein